MLGHFRKSQKIESSYVTYFVYVVWYLRILLSCKLPIVQLICVQSDLQVDAKYLVQNSWTHSTKYITQWSWSFWVCCYWFVCWWGPSQEFQSQKSWWLIQQKLPDRPGTTGRSGRRRIFPGSTDVKDPLVGGNCQICHKLVLIMINWLEISNSFITLMILHIWYELLDRQTHL